MAIVEHSYKNNPRMHKMDGWMDGWMDGCMDGLGPD